MKCTQGKSLSYNPYNGIKNIKQLGEKTDKINQENDKKYKRAISLEVDDIIEDVYKTIEILMNNDITDDNIGTVTKGISVIIMTICIIIFFLSLLS